MRSKSSNRGFSLVELMVGVMILGIVVSPLLRTFVMSAATASRSRRSGDATNAARNLIETVDAYGIDSIVQSIYITGSSSLGGIANDVGLYTPAASGGYNRLEPDEIGELEEREDVYIIGVKGMRLTSSGGICDAIVKLDATQHVQNTYPVANYNSMDAVFLQPQEMNYNPDCDAASQFEQEAIIVQAENPLLPTKTMADFYFDKNREIEVSVNKVPDDSDSTKGFLISSIEIRYEAWYEGHRFTYIYPSYDFSRVPYDEEEGDQGIDALYLFYYPNYGSGTDDIIINNPDDVPFKCFIVKQKTPEYAPQIPQLNSTTIANYEVGYTVDVMLVEGLSYERDPVADLYTNLMTNVITLVDLPTTSCTYTVKKGAWGTPMPVPATLVDTAPLNRLYTVSVELYEHSEGDGFDESNTLLEMEATTVE